jgi:hypothetical protein
MHDRGTVVNVFGSEDMGKLMNQSDGIGFRFGMRAGVTKLFVNWRNDVIPQSLLTIADSVDPRPTGDKILA